MDGMEGGYVKLWRRSLTSDVWDNPSVWRLWTWLLMKASHQQRIQKVGFQDVNLEPGELVFGRLKCAAETGLSEKSVRCSMVCLYRAGRVAIKRASKFSVISILNWDAYQVSEEDKGQQKGQQMGRQRASKGPAKGHKQECKEDNTGKDTSVSLPMSSGEDIPGKNGANRPPGCPAEKIIELYNSILTKLPRCKVFPESSRRELAMRWKESPDRWDLAWWEDFFKYVARIPFMRGENERGWRADLMWVVNARNFAKVINGTYPVEGEDGKRIRKRVEFHRLPAKTQQNLAAAEAVLNRIDEGRV